MRITIVLLVLVAFAIVVSGFDCAAPPTAPATEPAAEETAPPEQPTICAGVRTSFYSSDNNYLALINSVPCINASRIGITFVQPVKNVTLAFSGASANYNLRAYDEGGEELGSAIQAGEFNEGAGTIFDISFNSDSNNMKTVDFGGPIGGATVVVAIREISFGDGNTTHTYDFDKFPDGTRITGDTTNTEGLKYQSLRGDEFEDWGFLVSTD